MDRFATLYCRGCPHLRSDDLSREQLREFVTERQLALTAQLESWQDLVEFATPHLQGLEPVIVRHTLRRLEAELAWHEELLAFLDESVAE
ncbi:hypothetical protein ER308_17065 [Egibacter rhizosphaerae]|uniref:Uncharacterized protein n=1 Tax=Egibacter rhizosphaerae TaxID=1670831 RepID=A0A411YJ52_9ACTN|nr:hypothetical protein [Egibacter rhizosphaerae]QBI21112.1 hypothetical protein ER308_17065 [Egibacter rhizosphaerae]